jgi:hydroxysqualene synthase
MRAVSVNHYENFPVASVLCPPRLRPAVSAIYAFARTADDLADEGPATSTQRLADLADYRRDLDAVVAGHAPSSRWDAVFQPLSRMLTQHGLSVPLLYDLLSAFEQDVVKQTYADRAELLDYCRRSANPVGRLLLRLYGVDDPRSLTQSDAICSALQLANFWQDLSVDTARGRLYLPLAECERRGIDPRRFLARQDSPTTRIVIAEVVNWARALMLQGAPLVHAVPGRAGWELRLVVQGGLRILERIEQMSFGTLLTRPKLRWFDVPVLLWRAWRMSPATRSATRETA